MKILLVDDEEELVSALAERLGIRGIDAEWVISGKEALLRVKDGKFDLAVLDVKLPKLGGRKLKKALQEKCPDMKYIFMTGHGSEDDFQAISNEVGKEYYLFKPVNIDDLIKKIRKAVHSH